MGEMIELRAWERGLALRRHFSKLFVNLTSLTLYLQQSADYGLNTDFDCRPKGTLASLTALSICTDLPMDIASIYKD